VEQRNEFHYPGSEREKRVDEEWGGENSLALIKILWPRCPVCVFTQLGDSQSEAFR